MFAALNVELAKDIMNMIFDGADFDDQGFGNLLITATERHQVEHFPFASSQLFSLAPSVGQLMNAFGVAHSF